jgi:hypothetical protein
MQKCRQVYKQGKGRLILQHIIFLNLNCSITLYVHIKHDGSEDMPLSAQVQRNEDSYISRH